MKIFSIKKSMYVVIALSLGVSMPGGSVHAAAASPKSTGNTTDTNQIIVKLKSPVRNDKVGDYTVVEKGVGGNQSLASIEVPKKKNINEAVKEIDARKDVIYAEPDYKLKLDSVPNDPLYSNQWFHKVIKTEEAWQMSKGRSSLIVAVIDDGIDPEHPDLLNQITSPYDMVLDSNEYISVGRHGTHVSGIIAASSNNGVGGSGIAPDVKIMPINVFERDSTGGEAAYTSSLVNGIYYAINHGAKIINLSLGGY